MIQLRRLLHDDPPVTGELRTALRSLCLPLHSPADLDPLLDFIADGRYVLLEGV